MSKQPISKDLIELTMNERQAGAEALRRTSNDNFGYGMGTALDTIIDAINRVRRGDPEGTIRRHADGRIAVRTRRTDDDWLWWRVYEHHSGSRQDAPVSGRAVESWIGPGGECYWPVIYTPDADA